MLYLAHYFNSVPLHSIKNKQNKSSRFLGDKVLFGFNKSRGRTKNVILILKAVEKDSEFEIERDKAREALRKLDDQLLSLSNKQLSPPKIRAQDVKQKNLRGREDASEEISGSFLTYTASFLLVFTILYNFIFATVIKPAVDGSETLQYIDIIKEQKLSRSAELQLRP